jgi:hypothetical protein
VSEASDTRRDRPPVTLQISLAPGDLRHAAEIVPHQLRMWHGQFEEALLTLDLHRSAGHYGRGWEEGVSGIESMLDELAAREPTARVVRVDYSPEAAARISDAFFGGREVPAKAHDGAPVYAYYYGLWAARHDHVLHLDSDLLFGGGSSSWMREATEVLAERPDVLFCNPLAGPPTPDGELPPHVIDRMLRWGGEVPAREPAPWPAFRLNHVSSRLFLVDRRTLAQRLAPIPLRRPRFAWGGSRASSPTTLRHLLAARVRGRPHVATPEDTLSSLMQGKGLLRLDFLGTPPGMWSLHPTDRSESFFGALPHLVEAVESGDIPDEQLGDYNVTDSLLPGAGATSDVARPESALHRIGRRLNRDAE